MTNNSFKAVEGSFITWPGDRYEEINDCGDQNELCPAEDRGQSFLRLHSLMITIS